MNIIQTDEPDAENHHWELISSIQTVMSEICQSIEFDSWEPSVNEEFQKVKHIIKVDLQEIPEKVKFLWEFKLLSHVLILKVCLLDQQRLSHEIKTLCKKNRQKVIYYFNHINNITFSENQGEFYVHGDSKIIYQYRQDNWYALKNPLKFRHHLQKKLKKIQEMVRKNYEQFLIKFGLIPNLEIQKQQLAKLKTLKQLKCFFQQNRVNPCYPPEYYQTITAFRKNPSQIDMKQVERFDKKLFSLIQGKIPLNSGQKSEFSETESQHIQDLMYKFKTKTLAYNNFAEYSKDIIYPLVIAMEVIQVKNETALKDKGGFGKITRGLYSCKYGKTIYDDINRQLQAENYFSQQIFNRYLCKKSSLEKHCEAFQNEKQALMRLRNKKCPHIAQYYCNIMRGKPFDDGHIYMDVYASNIDQIPIKLKHKFKILVEIIRGLFFLNSNGILHRDMKPQNVVVDRQMNSKIIDFGSCSNVYRRQHLFKPYDSKLRSTKGYFVKYDTYQQIIQRPQLQLSKQQFYEHYFFDIYSYGKIIQKLFNLSEYEFVEEDLLMSQIYYLYEKCCQLNPADRLSHEEILFFLEYLIMMQKDQLK